MKKKGNSKEYRFMVGVLDSKTHSNIFYLKNLDFNSFDKAVAELKKKFR